MKISCKLRLVSPFVHRTHAFLLLQKVIKFNVEPDISENKCFLFYFHKKYCDFARSFFAGKLILAAACPTVDSLFFGQPDISNSRSDGPAAEKVNFDSCVFKTSLFKFFKNE